MRPDTYRAACALVDPMIKAMRATNVSAGSMRVPCPACDGILSLTKTTNGMAGKISGHCSTAFCVALDDNLTRGGSI